MIENFKPDIVYDILNVPMNSRDYIRIQIQHKIIETIDKIQLNYHDICWNQWYR